MILFRLLFEIGTEPVASKAVLRTHNKAINADPGLDGLRDCSDARVLRKLKSTDKWPWAGYGQTVMPPKQMTEHEAVPHEGVGPVHIGMSREEVRTAVEGNAESFRKTPADQHETDVFETAGFFVYYEGNPKTVEFIEVFPTNSARFLLFGVDVFGKPAQEVIEELRAQTKVLKEEGSSSFILAGLDVSLWRQTSEDNYFQALGIGERNYFHEEAA